MKNDSGLDNFALCKPALRAIGTVPLETQAPQPQLRTLKIHKTHIR
ncbi:hypothetical protein EMIT0357P_20017 [Pseudomonas marginalis]